MGTSALEQNASVQIDGAEYRLQRKVSDTCWQLEHTRTKRIQEFEHDQLLRKYADGTLTLVSSGIVSQSGPVSPVISAQDHGAARLRRLYVMAALDVPNTPQAINRAIAEVWEKHKTPAKAPSWSSVYRWKTRYLASKGDFRALVDYAKTKGNRSGRYPAEVIEFCNQSIETKFLKRERNTIQETLDDAVSRLSRENKLRPDGMALPLPTRRLITRLIKQIPAFDKHSARYGHEAARKAFRSVNGHRVTNAPLERAEIDHTILDLFVVDDRTSLPMGRPYVTACIDDFTRCILGIYVGFNPPSYQTVAQCLKDCFRPKVELRDEYPEIKSEWPAYGVMRELVLDNGLEFHSESLEQVCYSLGIEMHYSARREPWFKGKIERFFGSLNRGVAHGVPGTSFSNIFEKDDYDPAKHAVITLSTLKQIIRMWVADVYHQKHHRAIQTTPAAMWTSSIKPEDIRLPDDSTQIDAVMGRVYRRVLTHKGIEFEGLFYNSPELTEWRRGEGASLDVEIRVDESDIGSIHVLSPKTSRAYSVPALDQSYAAGISLWQHKTIKHWQAQHSDSNKGLTGLLQARETIARLIEEDFGLKRTRSRKRIARYIEGSERAPMQPRTSETTSRASQAVNTGAIADSLPAKKQPQAIRFDNTEVHAVQDVSLNLPDFEVIYKD